MCGRYFLPENEQDYPKLRVILEEINHAPLSGKGSCGGEVRPSEQAPVIVWEGGGYAVRPMGWGFPRPGGKGLIINSRSERAEILPTFAEAARSRRCLIPAGGFFEWKRKEGGRKGTAKFSFVLPESSAGELMYMAGLHSTFPEGERFVILTRAADSQMQPYHHRMPVILRSPGLKKRWLAGEPAAAFAGLRSDWEAPALMVYPTFGDSPGKNG